MIRFSAVVVVTLVSLLAVTSATGQGSGEPYKIGLLAPFAGHSSLVGTAFAETVRVLEEKINGQGGVNGHPLHIFGSYEEVEREAFGQQGKGRRYEDPLVFDTKGQPEQTKSACNELKKREVLAVIGPLGSESVRAAVEVFKESGPVLVAANASGTTAKPSSNWLYGTGVSPQLAVVRTLKYLRDRKVKKIAIVYHPVGLSATAKEQLTSLAGEYGVTKVEEIAVPLNQVTRRDSPGIRGKGVEAVVSTAFHAVLLRRMMEQRRSWGSIPLIQVVGVLTIDRMAPSISHLSQQGGPILAPVSKLRFLDELPKTDPQMQLALRVKKMWDSLTYPGWQTFILNDGRLVFSSNTPYRDTMQVPTHPFGQPFVPIAGHTNPTGQSGSKADYLAWIADKPATRRGMMPFSATAYDALMLVVDALKAVGPDKEKIRAHIATRGDFTGAFGTYAYTQSNHQGLTEECLVMGEFSGGKWKLIDK